MADLSPEFLTRLVHTDRGIARLDVTHKGDIVIQGTPGSLWKELTIQKGPLDSWYLTAKRDDERRGPQSEKRTLLPGKCDRYQRFAVIDVNEDGQTIRLSMPDLDEGPNAQSGGQGAPALQVALTPDGMPRVTWEQDYIRYPVNGHELFMIDGVVHGLPEQPRSMQQPAHSAMLHAFTFEDTSADLRVAAGSVLPDPTLRGMHIHHYGEPYFEVYVLPAANGQWAAASHHFSAIHTVQHKDGSLSLMLNEHYALHLGPDNAASFCRYMKVDPDQLLLKQEGDELQFDFALAMDMTVQLQSPLLKEYQDGKLLAHERFDWKDGALQASAPIQKQEQVTPELDSVDHFNEQAGREIAWINQARDAQSDAERMPGNFTKFSIGPQFGITLQTDTSGAAHAYLYSDELIDGVTLQCIGGQWQIKYVEPENGMQMEWPSEFSDAETFQAARRQGALSGL